MVRHYKELKCTHCSNIVTVGLRACKGTCHDCRKQWGLARRVKLCRLCGGATAGMFCNEQCYKAFYTEKRKHDVQLYRLDCAFKFNVSDYPEEFDLDLVQQHGWYSPKNKRNNPTGVSKDHRLSIRDGFRDRIDTEIMSHPANCRLLLHSDNKRKGRKSDITLEDLTLDIYNWNIKYRKVC